MNTDPYSPEQFLAEAAAAAPVHREPFSGITDPTILDRIARVTAEREHRHELLTTLASLRHSLGRTQDEVAVAWGRTQPQVSRLERDPTAAQLSTLISYLAALGHLVIEHDGTTHDLQLV
jgi:aryl-alcohol dehydrogenase-like predicted oxidoreductase